MFYHYRLIKKLKARRPYKSPATRDMLTLSGFCSKIRLIQIWRTRRKIVHCTTVLLGMKIVIYYKFLFKLRNKWSCKIGRSIHCKLHFKFSDICLLHIMSAKFSTYEFKFSGFHTKWLRYRIKYLHKIGNLQ